jgi:hypothetical protein
MTSRKTVTMRKATQRGIHRSSTSARVMNR